MKFFPRSWSVFFVFTLITTSVRAWLPVTNGLPPSPTINRVAGQGQLMALNVSSSGSGVTGLHVSTNAGLSWFKPANPPGSSSLTSQEVLVDGDTIFLARASQSTGSNAVLFSTNAGLNWIGSTNFPNNASLGFNQLAKDGANVYAALANSSSIWRSTNGGLNWEPATNATYTGGQVRSIGAANGRLMVGTSSGFYLLTGTNWMRLTTDLGILNSRMGRFGGNLLAVSGTAARRVLELPDNSTNYFGAISGLVESSFGAGNYRDVVASGSRAYLFATLTTPSFSSSNYLFSTTDGLTWTNHPTTGITSADSQSVALAGNGLFAAFGSGGGLYRVALDNGQPILPPNFTLHPAGTAVHPGSNITFTAAASSDLPLSLQWQKDGADLPGQNSSSLSLPNVQTNDSGSYVLVASNAAGVKLSTAAVLTVIPLLPGRPRLEFNPGTFASDLSGQLFQSFVYSVAAWTNDQVLVGGNFTHVNTRPSPGGIGYTNGVRSQGIARLNPDGSADPAFQPAPGIENNGVVQAIAVEPAGSILIGGQFQTYNGQARTNLARVLADGSADPGFVPVTFSAGGSVSQILPLEDGRFVVRGFFSSVNGQTRNNLARFNADGTLDLTWPAGAGAAGTVSDATLIGSDVVAGGSFGTFNGLATNRNLVRVDTNGAAVADFLPRLNNSVSGVATQPGGLLWTYGFFTQAAGLPVPGLIRLQPDGIVAAVSPTNLTSSGVMISHRDARLTMAQTLGGTNGLIQFRADGSVDAEFFTGPGFDNSVGQLAVTPSGDVYAAGFFNKFYNAPIVGLARLRGSVANVAPSAPLITVAPVTAGFLPGSNATLRAFAAGSGPMDFLWLKDGSLIASGPGHALVLSNFNAALAGQYQVVAQNGFGSVTSAPAVISVASAPVFAIQPPAVTGSTNGGNVLLSATVTGTEPISFQWYRSGAPVAGATASSYLITNLSGATTGPWTLVASNQFGRATSIVAQVSIGVPPVIQTQPSNQNINGSGNVSFSVLVNNAGSVPLNYTWFWNGLPVQSVTTNIYLNILSISNAVPTNNGSYYVVVSNYAGVVTSATRTVTVRNPYLSSVSPNSANVVVGGSTNFTAAVAGTAPIEVFWYRRGFGVNFGQTNLLTIGTNLALNGITRNDGLFNYFAVASNVWGSSTSSLLSLNVQIPPLVTNLIPGPVVTKEVSEFTTLGIQFEGNPNPLILWFKDGTLQPAFNFFNQLTFTSVQQSNAGTYVAVLSNFLGMSTSAPMVLNVLAPRPPTITNGPASQVAKVGDSLSLSVAADGTPSLRYAWYRENGTLVSAFSSSSFYSPTITTTNQAGGYYCVVTNSYGAATSAVAQVTVITPQPAQFGDKQFVKIADSLTFIPGLGANRFGSFRDAFLRNGQVWFGGSVPSIPFSVGVYHWNSGVLTRLVDTNTAAPGVAGRFTNFYGSTFLSDGKVVFASGTDAGYTGLYAYTNGAVIKLYDNQTVIPGRADTFDGYGWPTVVGNQFAFLGLKRHDTERWYRGVFISSNGVLAKVADTNTVLPNLGGHFVASSSQVAFDGTDVSWWGINEATNGGIFRQGLNRPIVSLADEATPHPGTGLNFDGFISPPAAINGRTYLVGHDGQFNTSLFHRDQTGPLHLIAQPGEAVPGRPTTFNAVGYPSIAASSRGVFYSASDAARYSGVFFWDGTNSTKVIDSFDTLEGQPIYFVYVADADEDCVLFYVNFVNGRTGLYATLRAGNTFSAWAAAYSFPPGQSDPEDDADGDGVSNIFEYYFGSHPVNGGSGRVPLVTSVVQGGQTYPALSFIRSRNVSGVTLLPQASSDVLFSNSLGTTVQGVTDLGNGTELVTIRSTVSSAVQSSQFLRIRLSQP